MKKYVAVAVGVVVMTGLTIGWGQTLSYLRGGRQLTQDAVQDRIPIPLALARVEQMVGDLDRVIERHRTGLIRAQVDVEDLEVDVAGRERRLEEDQVLLDEVAEMLDENRQQFEIGGIRYTRNEVEADANQKLAQFKCDRKLLDLKADALRAVRDSISVVEADLLQAESTRRALAGSIEVLTARKERLKARRELASVTTAMAPSGLRPGTISRVQEAVGTLERRLETEERILQSRIRLEGRSVEGIDYRAPAEAYPVSDQIRDTLMLEG